MKYKRDGAGRERRVQRLMKIYAKAPLGGYDCHIDTRRYLVSGKQIVEHVTVNHHHEDEREMMWWEEEW